MNKGKSHDTAPFILPNFLVDYERSNPPLESKGAGILPTLFDQAPSLFCSEIFVWIICHIGVKFILLLSHQLYQFHLFISNPFAGNVNGHLFDLAGDKEDQD